MPPKYGRGSGMQYPQQVNNGGGNSNTNNNNSNNGGGNNNSNKRMDHQQQQQTVGGSYSVSHSMQMGGPQQQQHNMHLQQQQQQQAAAAQAAAQQQQLQQQQQQSVGSSPCGDSFGMLGLVCDKPGETPELANKAHLVRGFDLGALGLSLVESSHLYPTFASPWSDSPSLLVPEYKVPHCYKVEVGRITYNTFQKFSEPTCFYVFYSMPRDLLQVAAAKELISRGYVYHTVNRHWLKHDPAKNTWTAFNPDKWAHEPIAAHNIREEDLMRSVPTTGASPANATAAAATTATTATPASAQANTAAPASNAPIAA